MFGLGAQELLLILVIVLVLFGGSKLPDLAKSLGKSVREFKTGIGGEAEEEHAAKTGTPPPAISAPSPTCGYCRCPLEAEWSHCPRCGTPVAQGPTPAPPK